MQPTLVITAPVEGMVFINGRFAGESRQDAPLFAPVAPFGPVWLEFRPLVPGYMPSARKLVFSSGEPIPESVSDDLFVILWPGGIAEIEVSPRRIPDMQLEETALEGLPLRIFRGSTARLETGGVSFDLPQDAQITQLQRAAGAALLMGTAQDGQFLIAFSSDLSRQTGFLTADFIEFQFPETIRAIEYSGDTAGHAVQSYWRLNSAGIHRISSEPIWQNGIPNRPASAEEAARAAVEASLLERFDEAESYFVPGARPALPLEEIPRLGSLCLSMKYGFPGSASAVALLSLETENLARALPLYYSATMFGDEWRLTDLRV